MATLQWTVIDAYKALMANLAELPSEIRVAQTDLTEAKRQLAATEKLLKERELVLKGDAQGKNADERAAALIAILAQDAIYRQLSKNQEREAKGVDAITIEMDTLQRQYGAVCYQARLHAALLQYLGSAGAPVEDINPDVEFYPSDHSAQNGTNGHVSGEDAAEIGL